MSNFFVDVYFNQCYISKAFYTIEQLGTSVYLGFFMRYAWNTRDNQTSENQSFLHVSMYFSLSTHYSNSSYHFNVKCYLFPHKYKLKTSSDILV